MSEDGAADKNIIPGAISGPEGGIDRNACLTDAVVHGEIILIKPDLLLARHKYGQIEHFFHNRVVLRPKTSADKGSGGQNERFSIEAVGSAL